ncbi:hypothetical protein RRG08_011062 [Elysia crispata]|uniref:Uncharacterized protein n=1 Tax=Elysia crispata TaxID=231223 RepID=A0AAE0Z938_9GAST|nr:hypothetical protein RRG08_011062 [Elysia crispata]
MSRESVERCRELFPSAPGLLLNSMQNVTKVARSRRVDREVFYRAYATAPTAANQSQSLRHILVVLPSRHVGNESVAVGFVETLSEPDIWSQFSKVESYAVFLSRKLTFADLCDVFEIVSVRTLPRLRRKFRWVFILVLRIEGSVCKACDVRNATLQSWSSC